MGQTERVYRGWDGIGLRHPETGPLRYSAPPATGRPPCDRSGRAPYTAPESSVGAGEVSE
jgi:hypothetical protein